MIDHLLYTLTISELAIVAGLTALAIVAAVVALYRELMR